MCYVTLIAQLRQDKTTDTMITVLYLPIGDVQFNGK